MNSLVPQPITLTGQVVSLEPLSMTHADALLEAAQSEEIWLHTLDKPRTTAAMHDYIARALGERDNKTGIPFAVRLIQTNRFIGSTRYVNIAPPRRGLEIGFTWYTPHYWRTAVNTECKYLLLKHAFETLRYIRVEFQANSENARSRAAILRLGATEEGTLRVRMVRGDGQRFDGLTPPLARALIRGGVHPNLLTTLGTLVVIASGVAFGFGDIRVGGALLLLSGVFDMLDGQVARQGGMTTTFGAFYDSTLDRVGEAAVFAGLAFYFLRGGVPPERALLGAGVALTALVASLLVSYTRARAEGLGVECKVGIAGRAERILLLGLPAVVFGGASTRDGALLFWIVVVLALVSAITVVQRVLHVARVASGVPRPPPSMKRETMPGVAAVRRKGP